MTKADIEQFKKGLTQFHAEAILLEDVRDAEHEINHNVEVPLTQNQFDALISLVFNIGPDGFRHSRLRTLLNEGDYLRAANNFRDWHIGGRGLTARRQDEEALFSDR